MKTLIMTLKPMALFGILTVFTSCSGQNQTPVETKSDTIPETIVGDTATEIGKNIRCIFQDSKNNFWFATDGDGVFNYDGKVLIQITQEHGLCSNFIWNVQECKDGKIWFKTREGVCFFDGKEFTAKQADETITQTPEYENTDLLVEYSYDGESLIKFQLPQTSPITNDNHSPNLYAVYCSLKDSKGNLWFGTDSRGVCKYDGKTFTWFDDRELGLAVRSIFEDRNGNIWIGNNGYGLFRYDGKNLTNFTREHNLENPDFLKDLKGKAGTLARVWTITDDKHGNLWIGTIDAGVWMYDGRTLTNYTTKDGLGSNSIWTIYKDKKDYLWFGAVGSGVYTFNGKTFEKFKP